MITFNSKTKQLFILFLKDSKLENYLLYGSAAVSFYSGKTIPISDIDLIASEVDFDNVEKNLSGNKDWNVFRYDKGLHINSLKVAGNDTKPFDISIDSLESYFGGINLDLSRFIELTFEERKLKVVTLEDLISIYKNFSRIDGPNSGKHAKKISALEKIS